MAFPVNWCATRIIGFEVSITVLLILSRYCTAESLKRSITIMFSLDCTDLNQCGIRRDAELCRLCYKQTNKTQLCFVHPIFRFWLLVTFGDEVTKIRKCYVIFVYILQGKMGKMVKTRKENHATKVTKIPKTKRKNMGWTKHKPHFGTLFSCLGSLGSSGQ